MNFINNKTLIYTLFLFSIIYYFYCNKKYYEKMSNTCKDEKNITIKYPEVDINCNDVKKVGGCEKDIKGYPNSQIIRAMCPKSCNVNNKREDINDTNWTRKIKLDCSTAIKDGACSKKVEDYPEPDIVKKYCPISCKVPVSKLEDHRDPGWKRESKEIKLTCDDVKSRDLCTKDYRSVDKYYPSPNEFNQKCPKTCDNCFGINCEVKDKDKHCSKWTKKGECRTNPKYMFNKTYGCNCSCSKWCQLQIKKNTVHAKFCQERKKISDDDYSLQS